jgi:hypothetical protein
VRIFLAMLALAVALFASPPAGRADEYDDDGKEAKKGDPKHGTAEEEAQRDKQRWEAWVSKLGDGPIYRVEVLFRDSYDERLYFFQHYVSPALPSGRLPGFGLDEQGKAVLPYIPGEERRVQELVDNKRTTPPLAKTSPYIGVDVYRKKDQVVNADITVGDRGHHQLLPAKLGEVEVLFFARAVFRIENVPAGDVLKAEPLRQDPNYFREHTEALKREILKTQRDNLAQSENVLIDAAYVFREPELIDGVREAFDRWIALPPKDFATRSFPTHLAYCLAAVGDGRDFEAFRRLQRRHPNRADCQTWAVLGLVKRVGTGKAMPLLEEMLTNPFPYDSAPTIEVLRELDPKIPAFTKGDLFLVETIKTFNLKPMCYELTSAEKKLAAVQKTQPLTQGQILKLAQCNGSDYLFLTEADRRAGVELVLDWYKQYQPPTNK